MLVKEQVARRVAVRRGVLEEKLANAEGAAFMGRCWLTWDWIDYVVHV